MTTALDASTKLVVLDDGTETLRPLTDLRPAFDIRTGAMTTLERLLDTAGRAHADTLIVPERLAPLARERFKASAINEVPEGESVLVSARWLMPHALATLSPNSALTTSHDGNLLAVRADKAHIQSLIEHNAIPRGVANEHLDTDALITYPWDVIRHRDACLGHDLARLASRIPFEKEMAGVTMIEPDNIFIHESATVLPSAMLDASHGPIVIDRGATVRMGAAIIGPAYIGPVSTVLDQALIKANTAIGPVCKIAGEVGGTIIQAHTNKAHDGHIGDSYLGEWVNLGAGTTNSNLLNTYGPVTATLDAKRHRTGLTFLGTIAGDHVKTAICSKLMTGTILHTGAMVAGSIPPPTETPPFAWLTDERKQTYRADKFLDVMRTVMARRKLEPGPAYTDLVRALADRAS